MLRFADVSAVVRACVCSWTAVSAVALYSALLFHLIHYVSVYCYKNVFDEQINTNKQTKQKQTRT